MHLLGAIIAWAVFGLVAGAIARLLVPGRQPMGIFATMALGIVGSLIGGFVAWAITGGNGSPLQGAGWIGSIIGAIVLLVAFVGMSSRNRRTL